LFKPGFYTVDGALPTNATPGNGKNNSDEDMAFYIANKASSGITINGVRLPSSIEKNKDPLTPSKFWGKICHGDIIKVWQHDKDPTQFTRFNFECYWGASKEMRPLGTSFTVLDEDSLLNEAVKVQELDRICLAQEEVALAAIKRREDDEETGAGA